MAGPGSSRRRSDRLQQQPQDDAAGTSEPSSLPHEDASEQASTSAAATQKKRGPYRGFNLLRLIGAGGSGDKRAMIHFPPGGTKPGGNKDDSTLPREIGLLTRTCIPNTVPKWKHVTPEMRAQLMERINAKFTHDAPADVFEKYCSDTLQKRFKDFRGEMSSHYKVFASEEEAREHPYPGVSVDDWAVICARFATEAFKKLSTTNTGFREKLKWNHLAGTKSFVAHRDSLSQPDAAGVSRDIGEIELFQHTHQYPGGAWIAPAAGESYTSMIQLRDQETQASLDASGGEASQPVSEADICSRVIGDQFLQTIGQRSRSRRSTSQRDSNVEGELRSLRERDAQREQELLRMQAEREREKAETDHRFADIERMFGYPGGMPSFPQQGGWVPPQPGWVPPQPGWVPPQGGYGGGMPPHGGYGGQPGGDPSSTGGGSTGGGYVMYPWGFPGGPDPSSGGWRWTGGGGGGGGGSGGGDGGGDGGGGSS